MSNHKRQAVAQKLGSFEGIEKEKVVATVEVILVTAAIPPFISRKRGHPPKVHNGFEVGQSSVRQPSMLSPSMQVVQAMQFDLLPEDEGVLAAISTRNLR